MRNKNIHVKREKTDEFTALLVQHKIEINRLETENRKKEEELNLLKSKLSMLEKSLRSSNNEDVKDINSKLKLILGNN